MLKEYPEYKETGLYWYEKIPCNWKLQKAKFLFNKESRPLKPEYETVTCFRDGEVTLRKNRRTTGFTESLQENGYQGVMPGDLVIHVMDAFAGAAGVSDSEGKCTPVYNICTAKIAGINNYFYAYFLRFMAWSGYIVSLSKGIRERSTEFRFDVFGNQFLPIPPISEQNAIVKYLDYKTKQIDEFVSAKEKEIVKLEELRCTLINTAVSRGIDNKNFKPSGMDWLPVIPEKWESINPKGLFALRKQKALKTDKQLTASQHHGVIFQEDYMAITGNRVVVVMKDFDILKHVEAGDFVISMRSFQGGIEYSENSGSISSAYVMLKPNLKFVYPKYFKWLFKSNLYITALQGTSDLVRDGQALRYANFVKVRLIKVPIEEQKAIADYLDKKTSEIDTLISSIQKQITLVKELRTKLIADVVTGKIDVREAV